MLNTILFILNLVHRHHLIFYRYHELNHAKLYAYLVTFKVELSKIYFNNNRVSTTTQSGKNGPLR